VTPLPGGPEGPPGGHYDPSASGSLDWDWRKCLVPGSAGDRGLCLWRKPGDAKPRWSAERRPWPDKGHGKTEDWCATRCSIPSHFARGQRGRPASRGQGRRPTRGRKKHGRFRTSGVPRNGIVSRLRCCNIRITPASQDRSDNHSRGEGLKWLPQ